MVSVGLLHRGKGEEPLFAVRKEGRHNHSDTSTSGDRLEAEQAVGQPLEETTLHGRKAQESGAGFSPALLQPCAWPCLSSCNQLISKILKAAVTSSSCYGFYHKALISEKKTNYQSEIP